MKFTTGHILSVSTAYLCCPISDLYEIMNYLVEESLFTHQLVRAFRPCQAWANKQLPWTTTVQVPWADSKEPVDATAVADFVAKVSAQFGSEHELQPLPKGVWESRDPLAELIEMVGKDKVVVVAAGGAS